MKNIFVYSVCGDIHINFVNISLQYLKRFSRNEILVVTSRSDRRVDHDQIIRVQVPNHLDNHQSSIYMKTNLHRIIGDLRAIYCYIDSDIVAIQTGINTIFNHRYGPITFAADHVRMPVFSRYAVNCPCTKGECDHLRQAIHQKFGIEVRERNWQHWNGGVFLFSGDSGEFMDSWHEHTKFIFEDQGWKTRDQGTLIATVWEYGLQNQRTLPKEYNFIVDAMYGIPANKRSQAKITDYHLDKRYSLGPFSSLTHPYFLHFINGAIGRKGWKNWDDVAKLLDQEPL